MFYLVSPLFPILFQTRKLWLSAERDGQGEKTQYWWNTITDNNFASFTYISTITVWNFFSPTSLPPFQTIKEWLRLEGNLWRSQCPSLQQTGSPKTGCPRTTSRWLLIIPTSTLGNLFECSSKELISISNLKIQCFSLLVIIFVTKLTGSLKPAKTVQWKTLEIVYNMKEFMRQNSILLGVGE